MTSRSLRSRGREPRGAPVQRRLPSQLHEILDVDVLPTAWRGFSPARHWLRQQPASTQSLARELVVTLARRHPELLTAPLPRKEIGACVVVRAASLLHRACRSLHTFSTTAEQPREQVIDLLRHLFVKFPVPSWTLTTLLSPTALSSSKAAAPSWVLPHIGQGGSFITAGLPVKVTRSMLHTLATTTTNSPRLAIRQAQLAAAHVGGSTANAVARVFADVDFGGVDEDGVVRFFAFVGACVKGGVAVDNDAGALAWAGLRLLQQDAACDFAGRTPASLIAASRPQPYAHVRKLGPLPKSPFDGGVVDGWRLTELNDGSALADESERMRNCVASYAPKVLSATTSIFHAEAACGGDVGLTVEVHRVSRAIVQVKGFANRAPRADELKALQTWAQKVGLRLTCP